MEKTDNIDSLIDENAGTFNIKILNREINFQFPNSHYLRNLVLAIFRGEDYPIFRFPDFYPKTIIDVGANVGATALYFHASFPEAQIYCYEPSTRNYKYLKVNTKYFVNIKTFPYGLYNRLCERLIYFGKDQPAQDSIVKNNETSEKGEMIKLVKTSEEIAKREIRRISILKVDTEGCEVPILNEFLLELKNVDIDLIYVEYHSEEDRLEIDRMISERFILFCSQAKQLHRGSKGFVSKALISKYPESEWLKIKSN